MKSYNEQEKSLLDSVCKNADGLIRFGGEMLRRIFIDASAACLLVKDEREGWIFTSPTSDESSSASFSKVVWLLSFLDHCEDQGYIYCVENDDYDTIMCGPCDSISLGVEKVGKKYTNADDEIIEVNTGECIWKDSNGRLIMKGGRCSKALTAKMKHYFASTIFPTSALFELRRNEYKTFEELSLIKQLRDARVNLCVVSIGLFISLLMPIISIFCSNHWGYTTMERVQYEKLINLLDSLNTKLSNK